MYTKHLFRDALIPKAVTRANSLINLNFGGSIAIGSAYTEPAAGAGTSRNFIKDLTGTDGNGNVWPTGLASVFGANVLTRIQSIPSEAISGANDAEKAVTLNQLFKHEIRETVIPTKGLTKYLHNEITQRTIAIGGSPAPQTDPVIIRHGSMTTDLKRMCVRKVFRLPADLRDKLAYPTGNANWVIDSDFKSGNYLGQNGKGDYRFKKAIFEDANGLYWRCSGDNGANGFADIPSSDPDTTTYWSVEDHTTPVFLDEWLESYIYIKRPETYWTRETPGDTNTPYVRDYVSGRTTVILHRLATDEWFLLCDQIGGEQMGVENCIWTRLFFLTYCNANAPIYIDTAEIEFFDNLPFTLESKGLA